MQPIDLTTNAGDHFKGVIEGTGEVGVVLANESDQDLCAWRSFASQLVTKGYEVLLFNYGSAGADKDVRAAADKMRATPSHKVFLIGASEGAKGSIIAATDMAPPLAGLVSLSAERYLQQVDVSPYASRLNVPALFVVSEADPYGAADAGRAFYAATPNHDKQLLLVPGSDHGSALVSSNAHPEVLQTIFGFLASH